ncbi:MAG: hypothetical protein WC965_04640 [Thiohalomonadaceae bacterium]
MAKGRGHIGFSLPEREKPQDDAFDIRPHKVEAWISQLPRGNVGETARQVFGTLHQTNRQQLSWKKRYQLLETIREPVHYVSAALNKHLDTQSLPLQTKTQRIAKLAITLNSEMALGYKIAIEDMLAGNFLLRSKKALTIMLHRALTYLNQDLLTCYKVYLPVEQEIWGDLHRLYSYAENRRLHNRTVVDKEQTIINKSKISTAYKQALLLSLATPYRLRRGEANTLCDALQIWADQAILEQYTPKFDHQSSRFVVHLNSNKEPYHVSFELQPCDAKQCRFLNLEPLGKAIQKEIDALASNKPTKLKKQLGNRLTGDLLHRLKLDWDAPAKRLHQRQNKQFKAEVIIGLTAIHRALSLTHSLQNITLKNAVCNVEALFDKTASYSSRAVEAENQTREDVWNMFKPEKTKVEQTQQASTPVTPLQIQNWDVCDESAGGYRVRRKANDTFKIQVGDLIGIRSLGEACDANWIISVVRWIQHPDKDTLEMGLQNLAHCGLPAAAKIKQADNQYSVYHRVIALPENQVQAQKKSLLTPPLLFNKETTLLIEFNGSKRHLKLISPVEGSNSFACFSYEEIHEPQPTANKEKPHPASPAADYSLLWKEL